MAEYHAGTTKHREVERMFDALERDLHHDSPLMISTNRPDMGLSIEWMTSGESLDIYEDGTWEYTGGLRPVLSESPASPPDADAAAILRDPEALHLHLLRNKTLSDNQIRHLLGDQPDVAKLRECLGFFASVIKSGEPWTDTCEAKYREALAGEEKS